MVLAKQLDDVEELEDFGLLQNEMIFASVFLIVLLARFAYMRATRPTALPSSRTRVPSVPSAGPAPCIWRCTQVWR